MNSYEDCEPPEDLAAELSALRREIAAYRELPLVPIAEYQRACDERDQYARAMDGLAKQLADAGDKRTATQLASGVRAVRLLMRAVVGRTAHGLDEQPYINDVKAWLVTNGASIYGDTDHG